MTQKILVVSLETPASDAVQMAVTNNCCAFLSGIPPVYGPLAVEQGWTLPCVITEDETGAIVSWEAA